MTITVVTSDGCRYTFESTGYCNDEHNNLEVMGGPKGEHPLGLFNKEHWDRVIVGDDEDDEDDDGE